MAVRFLSQIAPAVNPPALSDTVVGVTGGTTDNQFSLQQIRSTIGGLTNNVTTITGGTQGYVLFDNGGVLSERLGPFTPISGNLQLYVATTGSDSNNGMTAGTPFATLNHAFNVAAQFDYQQIFTVTINLASGTYTLTQPILVPNLIERNIGPAGATLQGAGASTTIIDAVTHNVNSCFDGAGIWSFGDITTKGDIFHYIAEAGAFWRIFDPVTIASSTGTFPAYFNCINGGNIIINLFNTVTVTAPSNDAFVSFGGSGRNFFQFANGSVVLPGSAQFSTGSWFSCDGGAGPLGTSGNGTINWFTPSVTNPGSYTNGQIGTAGSQVLILTTSGTLSGVPGGPPSFDSNTTITNAGGAFGTFWQTNAGIPTTADIPQPSTYAVVKDTSGGGVYLAVNDAGTIKKVQLV